MTERKTTIFIILVMFIVGLSFAAGAWTGYSFRERSNDLPAERDYRIQCFTVANQSYAWYNSSYSFYLNETAPVHENVTYFVFIMTVEYNATLESVRIGGFVPYHFDYGSVTQSYGGGFDSVVLWDSYIPHGTVRVSTAWYSPCIYHENDTIDFVSTSGYFSVLVFGYGKCGYSNAALPIPLALTVRYNPQEARP